MASGAEEARAAVGELKAVEESPRATRAADNSLKARGYRWSNGEDSRPKAWFRDVDDVDLAAEEQFLADEIYGGQPKHNRTRIDFRNRFSDRE